MPHKRAKRSAREADKASKGTDNAPTNKNEGSAKYGGLSANVYRILNAERIRKEKKERGEGLKRKRDDSDVRDERDDAAGAPVASTSGTSGAGKSGSAAKQLKIMPGEKLKNFNSRVEEAMRTDISSAIRHSKATRKKNKLSRAAQAKADAESEEAALHKPPPRRDDSGKVKERAVEFTQREKVKLNDVAMEPPSLKFAGLAKTASAKQKSAATPVSMKQQKDLDEERTRVIKQYRDIKARQLAQREAAS